MWVGGQAALAGGKEERSLGVREVRLHWQGGRRKGVRAVRRSGIILLEIFEQGLLKDAKFVLPKFCSKSKCAKKKLSINILAS